MGIQIAFVGFILMLTRRAWYCEHYNSRVHGCLGCWVQRFLFTIVVIAPCTYLLYDIHRR